MRILSGLWDAVKAVLFAGALLVVPALLIAGAGPVLDRALWLLAGYGVVATVAKLAMALRRPASLEVRRLDWIAAKSKRQPLIDVIGLLAYMGYIIAWFAFIPLDTARLHLFAPPAPWASAVGMAAALAGASLSNLAIWQNAFAAPAIHDQSDRGQRVIDHGLYGLVRHPLYAANLLFFAGTALWLGSLAALLGVAVNLAATLARIGIEERWLRANLPGYADYALRVRARLIPFLI